MPEQTTADDRGRTWSGWVGESPPMIQGGRTKLASATSGATVVLLWLSSAVLIASGYRTTVSGDKGVSGWSLVGLAALSLVVVGLALAARVSPRRAALAVVSGLVLAIPWILAGIYWDEVDSDGSVVLTVALVVVAIISGSAETPPQWLRFSALFILLAVVWLSLTLVIMDRAGADFGTLHLINERFVLGFPQMRGVLGHPNTMALLASFTAVVSLQFTRAVARSARMSVAVSVAVLGPATAVIVVLLTQSRIGYATLTVGLILVLLPLRGSSGRVWSYVLIGGLCAASLLPPVLTLVAPLTFHGRTTPWLIALVHLWENPLIGAGPDGFLDIPSWLTTEWIPDHAHSTWLQVVSSAGLVGLAVLLLAVVGAVVIAVRAREFDHDWWFGVIGVFAAYSWVEPALGVAAVPVTFLPVVLAASVMGSAYTMAHPWARVVPELGTPPRSPNSCEV